MNDYSHAGLPQSVRHLIDEIGDAAALTLVELRGGTPLYVPGAADPTHWLVPHIGLAAFQALVLHYGGDYLELPRCAASVRMAREQRIIADAAAGVSASQLAREHGLTRRWINQIKANHKQRGLPGQKSLPL